MKKQIMICMFAILLMATVSIPVGAATVDNSIQPLWANTVSVNCSLDFDNGIGYAGSSVKAFPGTSSIKTDIIIYKQVNGEWIYVTELHDTQYKTTSNLCCEFAAENGAYYRADYTITVTKRGIDEIINQTNYKLN